MENYHAVETGGKITAIGARYSDDSARSSMT
jgi:hypothetical protein